MYRPFKNIDHMTLYFYHRETILYFMNRSRPLCTLQIAADF
jgi:hypothetical protein